MKEVKNICKKVAKLRRKYDLSVSGLAELSGVSRRTINRIEQAASSSELNTYAPRIDTVKHLAYTMNYSFKDLVNTPQKQLTAAW